MKVLCAWCVRDGRPAFLREKWPFEDPSETHGLCGDHFTSLSVSVSQVVTPKVWFLSRVHDLSWGFTRWLRRLRGRFLSLLTVGIEEVPGTLARVAGPQVLPEFSSQEIQSLLDQRGIRQLALRRQLIDEAGEQICELTARGFRAQPDL